MTVQSRLGNIKDVSRDSEFELGTDVWNIAGGFTHQKLLKLIAKLDTYETIAEFGKEEIDYDFYLDGSQNAQRRYEGIKRFASTLYQLCGNIRFAVKVSDAITIRTLMKRIATVRKYLDSCIVMEEDLISKKINYKINERLFGKCLSILSEIKDDVNFPMNRAGLIFRRTDDVDLDHITKDIIFGG